MEKISIITPVLNRRDFICDALDSVVAQQGGGFAVEHIVVDGLSTDGPLECLARYPHVRIISEKDKGVYDALNKGIRAATGTIIGLLNSDDIFLPGTLAEVEKAFASDAQAAMLCLSARLAVRDASGQWVTREVFPAARFANLPRPEILAGGILTNSRFYRPRVLNDAGLFDLSLGLISDRKLLLDIFDSGERFVVADHLALEYRSHAGSLTFTDEPRALLKGIWEKLALAERYLSDPSLPPAARNDFRAWHRHEVLQGLILSAKARNASVGASLLRRGFRGSALWPLEVLPEAGRLLRRRLDRARSLR